MMAHHFLPFLLLLALARAQTFQWNYQLGGPWPSYPANTVVGVRSPLSSPGTRVYGPAGTLDPAGSQLWVFGGAYAGMTNDLWNYDFASGQWMLVTGSTDPNSQVSKGIFAAPKGVPHPLNQPPGAFHTRMVTDPNGDLWTFGGNIGTKGYSNMVWNYNVNTGMWTWVSGNNSTGQMFFPSVYGPKGTFDPSYNPCSRASHRIVSANDGIWLFGGTSNVNGYEKFADLWFFSYTTRQWGFISGTLTPYYPGNYSVMHTPSPDIFPAAREHPGLTFSRSQNVLWIFGGETRFDGLLNDLWMYNISSGDWSWEAGWNVSLSGQWNGVYGTMGVASPGNTPGRRRSMALTTASDGRVYMFGGFYNDIYFTKLLYFDDVWRYDPFTRMWTWLSGQINNQFGGNVAAVQRLWSPLNQIGGRMDHVYAMDPRDQLWIMGGAGPNPNKYSDLWIFASIGPCSAGNYYDATYNLCRPCPLGNYNGLTSTNATSCTPCPAQNSSTLTTGSTSLSQCVCQPNFYGYASNNTCTPCPAHTTKLAGDGEVTQCVCPPNFYGYASNNTCTSCPAYTRKPFGDGAVDLCLASCGIGEYYDSSSQSCLSCPVGTINPMNNTNTRACTPCPANTNTTGPGSSQCQCSPGYFGSASSNCTLCPVNTFKSDTADLGSCIPCASGSSTLSLLGRTNPSQCVCMPGFGGSGHTSCTPCIVNTYKSNSSNTACTACSSNTVTAGPGRTLPSECVCTIGYTGNNSSCIPCPIDTFKDRIGSSPCSPCSSASTTNQFIAVSESVGCVCKPGYFGEVGHNSCEECPGGSVKEEPGNGDSDLCTFDDGSAGMSSGAVAGITVGVVVPVGAMSYLGYFLYVRKNAVVPV